MDDAALHISAMFTWLPILVAMVLCKAPHLYGISSIVLLVWICGTTVRVPYLLRDPSVTVVPSFTTLEESVGIGSLVLGIAGTLTALGYLASARRKKSRPIQGPGSGIRSQPYRGTGSLDRRIFALGVASLVLGVAALVVFVALRFGSGVSVDAVFFESSRIRSFEISEGVTGNLAILIVLIVPAQLATAALIWQIVTSSRSGKIRRALEVGLVVALGAVPFAFGILSGSRQDVLMAIIFPIWIYLVCKRAGLMTVGLSGIGGIAAVAPIVVMQGNLRIRGELGDDLTLGTAVIQLATWIGETGHFVAIERTGYIAEYVYEGLNEFSFARSIILGLLTFIPRVIFPEKPVIHEGNFVADAIAGSYSGAGFPAGLVGGLMLNFGVLGILGMLMYGVVVARLDAKVESAAEDLRDALYVAAFGPLVAVQLLQSSIATSVPMAIIHGVWLWVMLKALGIRRGAESQGEGMRAAQVRLGVARKLRRQPQEGSRGAYSEPSRAAAGARGDAVRPAELATGGGCLVRNSP